jgi:hypothetical protein
VLKRLVMVLVLIGSLLFAASASARDRNGDRIPDRWEKRHGLSLKVDQARKDQDDDGFKNRAEWRAKTDPRKADSDDDGVDDSDENAGTVTAYENGELTITLFANGEAVTATVTDDTEVQCGCDDRSTASKSDDDPDDDEGDDDDDHGGWDDDPHGDRGEDDDHGHHGERGHGDDDNRHDGRHGDDDGERCADDALAVGALVEEAELKLTSEGKVWREIELR